MTLPGKHSASGSLRATLEHDRLHRRARRLEQVVAALNDRVHEHVVRGRGVPAPLSLSLADYHAELAAVREMLPRQPVRSVEG